MPYLSIIQVITAILLVIAILLQSRGSGLGMAFGGDGNSYRTKRGMEKTLHLATIILSIIFFGIALANLFFKA